nr:hypothetical protein [Tanacetum cinerariifolium]
GFVDPDHPEKGLPTQESSLWIEASSKGMAKYALEILHKHGMDKGQSIGTPMATKPKVDTELSGNPVDQTDYRSKIRVLAFVWRLFQMLITPDALILIKALLEEYNS